MELNLHPTAPVCAVTGGPFAEGQRVTSLLVRHPQTGEISRRDLSEQAVGAFVPEGVEVCRWTHLFRVRKTDQDAAKAMKLTADNLFVTLADPSTEPTQENIRLVQFLALMLERKKLLRPRGRSTDGTRTLYEHARTRQMFEVPVGELTPEFFMQVQQQLSVLVGEPKAAAPAG